MRRTPPRAVTAAEASSTPRWAGTWNDVTSMIAAWAKLDHAANRMRLRCAGGFRAARNTKTPSVASAAFNIGPAVQRGACRMLFTTGTSAVAKNNRPHHPNPTVRVRSRLDAAAIGLLPSRGGLRSKQPNPLQNGDEHDAAHV